MKENNLIHQKIDYSFISFCFSLSSGLSYDEFTKLNNCHTIMTRFSHFTCRNMANKVQIEDLKNLALL